ncbi:hypothetical protein V8C26DRAFT_128507 [Trichoderma gracile]
MSRSHQLNPTWRLNRRLDLIRVAKIRIRLRLRPAASAPFAASSAARVSTRLQQSRPSPWLSSNEQAAGQQREHGRSWSSHCTLEMPGSLRRGNYSVWRAILPSGLRRLARPPSRTRTARGTVRDTPAPGAALCSGCLDAANGCPATSRIYSGRTCTACCRARQAPSAFLETLARPSLPYPVQSVAANALAAAVHASEGGAIRGSLVGRGSTRDELPVCCWSRSESIRGPWAKVKDKDSGKTPPASPWRGERWMLMAKA